MLLVGVSAIDYWDHVSRPGEPFAQHPIAWLGFTAASTLTVFAAALGAARLLAKSVLPQLACDVAGIAFAVGLHVLVSGPLWAKIFWPGAAMEFDQPLVPIALACAIYLAFRALHVCTLKATDMIRRRKA
ncbi:MAG TPA: hypothetical protein VK839_04660 [Erythrobacter sp.]|nr:hypothetical protein [Erythrobacter sp.]